MKKYIPFAIIFIILSAYAGAQTISSFPAPSNPLQSTDKVPIGRQNDQNGYSATMAQIAVFANQSGNVYKGNISQAKGSPPWAKSFQCFSTAIPSAHSYARILINSNNGNTSWLAITDIQFRGTVGGPNLATGGTATASVSSSGPSNAFDGNSSTEWDLSPATFPQWIQYSFPAPVRIAEWTVSLTNGFDMTRAPKDMILQVSDDGSTWTTLDTRSGVTGWVSGVPQVFDVPTWSGTTKACASTAGDTAAVSGCTITMAGSTPTITCPQSAVGLGPNTFGGTQTMPDIIKPDDVRYYMDGQSGRPTLATWQASQSTTDVTLSIQAAVNAGVTVHFPAGTFLTDTIQLTTGSRLLGVNPYGSASGYPGAGAGSTILRSHYGNHVLEVNGASTNYLHSIEVGNLLIYGNNGFSGGSGSGHGIYAHDSIYGGSSEIYIHDVQVAGMGGKGIYMPTEWHTTLDRVGVWACGDNNIEIQGGNTTTLDHVYAHSVATNKAGFRIYGQATLIGCNGVDSGTNTDWGVFGQTTASGDPINQNAMITLINCNVEAYGNRGICLKGGSRVDIKNTTFQNTATNGRAIYFDTDPAGVYGSHIDNLSQFLLEGSGTWANSYPIHSAVYSTPFAPLARNDLYVWDETDSSVGQIPYVTPDYLTQSIKINQMEIGPHGGRIIGMQWGYAGWTPGTIANGSFVTTNVTVSYTPHSTPSYGQYITQADFNGPLPAGVFCMASVTGTDNTVQVTLLNLSGSPVTLGYQHVTAMVWWLY